MYFLCVPVGFGSSASVDLNRLLLTLPSSNGFADVISFLDKDFHPNVVHSCTKQKLLVEAPISAFFPFGAMVGNTLTC